jgi:hypothetical protein
LGILLVYKIILIFTCNQGPESAKFWLEKGQAHHRRGACEVFAPCIGKIIEK